MCMEKVDNSDYICYNIFISIILGGYAMYLSEFTNQYSLSKTLRFKLVPQGHTLDNMKRDMILSSDQKRADEYGEVKKLIDRYHKAYIERKLSTFSFPDVTLDHCAALYYSKDTDNLEDAQRKMMQSISDWLRCAVKNKPGEEFKALFSDQMVKSILPAFLEDEGEKQLVSDFAGFWTYFTGFCQNRENMYTGEGKATEIAYRIVKQNLPKFLDNLKVWEKIRAVLPESDIAAVDADIEALTGMTGDTIFTVHAFNKLLTQSGIEAFNRYIGGYTNDDGSKVQGLNEKINLYTQKTGERLPIFKPLFKQILSDRDSVSFIPEMFGSDNQLLETVRKFYEYADPALRSLHSLLSSLSDYDPDHIYVANDTSLTSVSNYVYNSWSAVRIGLERLYEENHPLPNGKPTSKYEEAKEKYLKSIKSVSLAEIGCAVSCAGTDVTVSVADGLAAKENELYTAMTSAYEAAKSLIGSDYPETKSLVKEDDDIQVLKAYLDSVKEYQHFVDLLAGDGTESDKDSVFYGVFEEQSDVLCGINRLYDMVRNYATKKPFSTDKIRMMFNRSDFLGGWAQPDEWNGQEAHLFKKGESYYIFVTSRTLKSSEWSLPLCTNIGESPAEHLEYYFQKPDNKNTPRLFIRSKGDSYAPAVRQYNLPIEDVIDIYDGGYFKTEYRKKDPEGYRAALKKMIDYFKLGFTKHESYRDFEFEWKPSDVYTDISEFYRDTINSCYRIRRSTVNFNGLQSMADNGLGYLFEIYSKDFSPYSHGTPNLHTLYFKALFDESTAGRVRLQGGAQIYYRAPSLKLAETTVHPANSPVNNKNPLNPKPQSTFDYDMIKDKRYTCDHFELHIPVSLNATAAGYVRLNDAVRTSLVQAGDQYIIGIDRGERNLLYISVIDSFGHIIEQFSLNVIEDAYGDTVRRTDYHDLLDRKEKSRLDARREWKTIEGIKEVKEGYLSQAVHRICCLVEKYGAIVVMENLNAGFKNTRSAVEKSVYQKFEKMLCDKLSFMVNKQKQPTECGGVLNAYQLAEPTTSYTDMRGQNGIIFYVPAWLTSKIDPTTGFADMLRPRYESVESAKDFFGRFDSVTYNTKDNLFEFAADLTAFPKTDADHRKKWVICTNGERIRTFRNEAKNNQWDNDVVRLTDEMIRLFDDYGIDYKSGDLRPAIMRQTEKAFFTRLIGLLKLTLQMRNSITGTDVDYMVSPVRNAAGTFYDSRLSDERLPRDADANGAYNIARKGLWVVEQIKQAADVTKVNLAMTNAQWLEYAQTHFAGEEAE